MKLLEFATVPPHKWIVWHLEAEVVIRDRSTFKKVKFDRTVCIMIMNGGKLPHYLNGDTSFFDRHSRTAASAGVSPTRTFPPGNSQNPARLACAGRWPTNMLFFQWTTAMAATVTSVLKSSTIYFQTCSGFNCSNQRPGEPMTL